MVEKPFGYDLDSALALNKVPGDNFDEPQIRRMDHYLGKETVQNHLMQLLCLVAMEPMVSFEADEIRNKKVDVLHALRPIPRDQVRLRAGRGQYGPGWFRGRAVPGHRGQGPGWPGAGRAKKVRR